MTDEKKLVKEAKHLALYIGLVKSSGKIDNDTDNTILARKILCYLEDNTFLKAQIISDYNKELTSDAAVEAVGKKAWLLAVGEGQMVGSFEEQEKFWKDVGMKIIKAAINETEKKMEGKVKQ